MNPTYNRIVTSCARTSKNVISRFAVPGIRYQLWAIPAKGAEPGAFILLPEGQDIDPPAQPVTGSTSVDWAAMTAEQMHDRIAMMGRVYPVLPS